jgi:4-aminobutyrate aminotransferase-like enzyme
MLRALCTEHKSLLILDEIYTGFGRTGKSFACEHSQTVPDIICLGKALTGGFPLSACVGGADVMDRAWPISSGEAIHTSTFLGHPVGCAMALAQLKEIKTRHLVEKSEQLGKGLMHALLNLSRTLSSNKRTFTFHVRGQGLLIGMEIRSRNGMPATSLTLTILEELLQRGFILLPEGEHSNVVSFTPPLTVSMKQLVESVQALERSILEVC